jgi:hypothetical protein
MGSIGFQQGVLRRSIFRDGQWRDMAIYGILREDVNVETKQLGKISQYQH